MFTTILCATDGSQHADRALRYAAALAEQDRCELHIVHVTERLLGGRLSGENVFLNEPELHDAIRAQATRIASETGVNASLHIVKGTTSRVANRLSEVAVDLDADLIVVGTHGRTPLGGLVLASVTQRLLHVTSRPVLALPPERGGAPRRPAPVPDAADAHPPPMPPDASRPTGVKSHTA
jgi:nucleotide-binding universal stress UspA family protein